MCVRIQVRLQEAYSTHFVGVLGNTGAAYVYERDEGGTLWSRHSKLIARDIGANSNFAAKLALYGMYICMYV